MSNDKHTDRMLGRKLGSYEAKPAKLTFDTLHKNYLAEKKRRAGKRIIKGASILAAVGGILALSWFFLPGTASPVAEQKQASQAAAFSSATLQTNSPVHTLTDSSKEIAYNSGTGTKVAPGNTPSEQNAASPGTEIAGETAQVAAGKDTPETPGIQNTASQAVVAEKGAATGRKETAASRRQASAPQAAITPEAKTARENKTLPATKTTATGNTTTHKENAAANPGAPSSTTAPASPVANVAVTKNKTREEVATNLPQQPDAQRQENREPKSTRDSKTQLPVNGSRNGPANGTTAASDTTRVKEETIKSQETGSTEDPYNEPVKVSAKESQVPVTAVKADSSEKHVNQPEIVKPKITNPAPAISASTAAAEQAKAGAEPTPPPAKTNGLLISTEVVLNTFSPKISPGSDNSNARSFSETFKTKPHRQFSGAALLGYKYKNAGINTGIGFANIETEVDPSAFSKTKTTYSMTIHRRDSLVPVFTQPQDTMLPPVVTGYTTFTRIDTTYTPVGTTTYVVVNGDSVKPQVYVNTVRFLTIPVHLSYSFNLLKNKLALEPQVGIQVGIPVTSYQFIQQKKDEFSYSRTKAPLKPKFFFYDFSLKVNYRLGRYAFIYLKQGYFFNSKSIYSGDYPLSYSLSNLYTAFGLSVLIN